jgi:hypothetical protein
VINVSGNVAESGNRFFGTNSGNVNVRGLSLDITVQGTSPSESFITGTYPTTDNKWWQTNDANLGGTTIRFKNLTIRNFGSLTTTAAANGAVVNMSTAISNGKVAKFIFENVVITGMAGRTIFNLPSTGYEIELNNCLIKDNVLTAAGNPMNGIVTKSTGGNIKITNCTFYSNSFKPLTTATRAGAVLSLTTGASQDCNLIFENNALVNNQFESAASTAGIQGLIDLNTNATPGTIQYSFRNNIFVGNIRSGSNLDVDLHIPNLAVTPISFEGNILNEAVQRLGDGTEVPYTYPRLTNSGLKIDKTYTYTDPRINFTMDGNLPKLTNDANGIGKVSYSGDGGNPSVGITKNNSGSFIAYAQNLTLKLEGINPGEMIELYNITGNLIRKAKATGSTLEFQMAEKGIYIVRAGNQSQKVVVY